MRGAVIRWFMNRRIDKFLIKIINKTRFPLSQNQKQLSFTSMYRLEKLRILVEESRVHGVKILFPYSLSFQ